MSLDYSFRPVIFWHLNWPLFYANEIQNEVHGNIDHTRKHSEVEPSDGHISTTKKDNKILWRNSLPLLS